jgi:hypothetical protein
MVQQSRKNATEIEGGGDPPVEIVECLLLLSLFMNSFCRFGGFRLPFLQGVCQIIEGARHLAKFIVVVGQRRARA